MIIGLVTCTISIPEARSLQDKRPEIVQSRVSEVSAFLRGNPRYVLLDLHTEML